MAKRTKTTAYFDGSCPLCSAEISVYRKRALDVEFVDVSKEGSITVPDLSSSQAMKRFHVRRKDGTLLSGGDAFTELWRQTRGFRLLGRLFQLPGLRVTAHFAYEGFLFIRPIVQKLFVCLSKSR